MSSSSHMEVSKFEQVPGLGVHGVCEVDGIQSMFVRFGSLEFIKRSLPPGSNASRQLALAQEEQIGLVSSKAMSFLTVTPLAPGPSNVGSSQEPTFIAMLLFDDAVEPQTSTAVATLQSGEWKRGGGGSVKQVVMLTGDNEGVAAAVAKQTLISEFHYGLKPEEKLDYIRKIRGKVLMMGDGINDSPALAGAHVGVAVAKNAQDLVSAAADMIVLNGQGVSNLPWLFAIANKLNMVVRQSLFLALASVVFATIPVLFGWFPLWLAVLLHEGATLLVALNSLRLLLDPYTPTVQGALSSGVSALKEMFS